MADLNLNVRIKAINNFTSVFARFGTSVVGAGAAFAGFTALVATGVAVLSGLIAVVERGADAWTDYELAVARADVVTDGSEASFARLNDTMLELGRSTFFTTTEVAKAAFELGQAGLNTAEVLEALEPVLDLATIGFISTSRAGEIATDILASLGLEASDLTRVVDVLTVTFTNSNTTIDALGTAFSKIGPLAAALGIELEELAAAMGILANNGIKGEEAGTALRNIFLRLLNPNRRAERTLAALGITADEVAQGMFDLEDILVILGNALDQGAISAADISEIFQARATPAILALIASIDDGTDSLSSFEQALLDSGGAAEDILDVLEDTQAFTFAQLRASIEQTFIEIGGKLAPALEEMAELFRENSDELIKLVPLLESLIKLFVLLVQLVIILEPILTFLFQSSADMIAIMNSELERSIGLFNRFIELNEDLNLVGLGLGLGGGGVGLGLGLGGGFQAGGQFSVRGAGIAAIPVHAPEVITVTNPNLGQSPGGEQVTQNVSITINTQETNPFLVERAVLRGVRLAKMR